MKLLTIFLISVSFLLHGEENRFTSKDYSYLIGMQGFNENLLQMHFKLYQGYVDNTNRLLDLLNSYVAGGQKVDYQYGALKRRFGWEYDGMRLHEYYFDNLGGVGSLDPKSALYKKIASDFGSFDAWKSDFISTGMMRGIGWSVLYFDPKAKRLFNVWINEHDLGHLAGGIPLLVMDVFEHAYMPQYGLDKAKYIEAFFKNVNWETTLQRFLFEVAGQGSKG